MSYAASVDRMYNASQIVCSWQSSCILPSINSVYNCSLWSCAAVQRYFYVMAITFRNKKVMNCPELFCVVCCEVILPEITLGLIIQYFTFSPHFDSWMNLLLYKTFSTEHSLFTVCIKYYILWILESKWPHTTSVIYTVNRKEISCKMRY